MKRLSLLLSIGLMLLMAVFLSCDIEDYPYLLEERSIVVTLHGKTGPWDWVNGGLNTDYQYDYASGTTHTAPVVVNKSSGLFLEPGNILIIQYISGTVSGGAGDGDGANGDLDYPIDYNPGGVAYFADESDHPIYLITLMGVFTDASGALVGKPFKIGNGPREVIIPDNAVNLQMGFNDGMYSDNGGSLTVRVTEYWN